MDADAGPVLDRGQAVGADAVDERHAGLGEHLGTEVRVAAGDQVAGVDDRRHPGVGEGLGGGPVEVQDVEDGDVTGPEPRQEQGDPPLDAGGAVDAGKDP